MASKLLSKAEVEANRFVARATYRDLLRATGLAFKGDSQTLLASRAYARQSFHANRHFESGTVESAQAIEHAQGVTRILRENVVQGRRKGEGGDTYRLNIHEHTQRLDNDTAGQLKGTTKSFKQVKNAQF